MMSQRLAVHESSAYCKVENGARYVPRLLFEPPLAFAFNTLELFTQKTLPGCICNRGIPRTMSPEAKPWGKFVTAPPIGMINSPYVPQD